MGDETAVQLPVIPPDEEPIDVPLPEVPEEGTDTEEEAEATDPSGEEEPPAGAGDPVVVEDSAIVLAAIAAAAAVSVLRMQAKGRKDIGTTFAAEALSKIRDPDAVLAELRASAEARVQAQRDKGANDAYLAKQLVGRVAGVRGTSV
jgi:hypothetical protein